MASQLSRGFIGLSPLLHSRPSSRRADSFYGCKLYPMLYMILRTLGTEDTKHARIGSNRGSRLDGTCQWLPHSCTSVPSQGQHLGTQALNPNRRRAEQKTLLTADWEHGAQPPEARSLASAAMPPAAANSAVAAVRAPAWAPLPRSSAIATCSQLRRNPSISNLLCDFAAAHSFRCVPTHRV